jgi:ABC-type spermidine/putrescine transport system permease subunit I
VLSILYIYKNEKRMKFLLPHRFKRIGAIMAPVGLLGWLLMQMGWIKKMLVLLFDLSADQLLTRNLNTLAAAVSFFSFLAGIYMVSFYREKIEDEMVQRTRLESFQFAAVMQLLAVILGFAFMAVYKEPREGGMMLFFISLVGLFWLSFIGRFNYILHLKLRQ